MWYKHKPGNIFNFNIEMVPNYPKSVKSCFGKTLWKCVAPVRPGKIFMNKRQNQYGIPEVLYAAK